MRTRRSVLVLAITAMTASVLMIGPAAGTGHDTVACDDDYVTVDGNRIHVAPTGVDDTENLQCALDLAASMPWAKIRLSADDYFTSFLEVEGFSGVLRGAGREKTTILTLPDGLDCVARLAEIDDFPGLMMFAASKVTVNGITFAVGGDAPCAAPWAVEIDDEGFGYEDWSLDGVRSVEKLRPDEPCRGEVKHRLRAYDLAFVSELPGLDDPVAQIKSFNAGIAVGRIGDPFACTDSWLTGPVVVRHSQFVGNLVGVVIANAKDSAAVVGGTRAWHANEINQVNLGVVMFDSDGTKILIKGNDILDARNFGVIAAADVLSGEQPSDVVVAKNTIRGIAFADGVGVFDAGLATHGKPLLDTRIWWNKIEMVDTPFNGIIAVGTDGKIIGNRIHGSSFTGIMLDGVFDQEAEEILAESSGWYVAKNRLKALEPFGADIWLWPSTTENTVMCRCGSDEVVDLGVDNTIIGCSLIDPPPEPTEAADVATGALRRTMMADKAMPPSALRRLPR